MATDRVNRRDFLLHHVPVFHHFAIVDAEDVNRDHRLGSPTGIPAMNHDEVAVGDPRRYRLERCPACWCECRAAPGVPARPSSRRPPHPNRRPALRTPARDLLEQRQVDTRSTSSQRATNTGISGARLYWDYWGKGYFNAKGVTIPVAVSVFPDELSAAPRSWAERAYPKLIHYNTLPKGGHFAGWEQPKFLSEEIRAGFRSLR
jgi:pimeloyl-ACP methyl ester carboxylesterase